MTGPNPTDRVKLGTKHHILTDQDGIPLSVVITAASTHDMKVAINTLDNIVVKRPSYKINKEKQNLCLDKGYDFQEIENRVIKKGYSPHIRHRLVIIILREEDGLLKELIPGITGSENS
jgi:putative transposase